MMLINRNTAGQRPQRNSRDIPKWHPTLEGRCLTFLDAHPEMTAWLGLGNMVMIADSHSNALARCGFAFLDATAIQTYLWYANRYFSNQHSSCVEHVFIEAPRTHPLRGNTTQP